MSDTTDDMEAGAALYEAHLERIEEDVRKKVWTTRDGQRMKISDMADSHLTNTINLIRRATTQWRDTTLKEMYRTLGLVRGEQAIWDIEHDIDRLEESTIDEIAEEQVPHFENLMAEATKRKLEVING